MGRKSREYEHVQVSWDGCRLVRNEKRAAAMLKARPDGWMATLGARITEAEPGRVVLELEAGPQHRHGGGVVQGGVITQIADAAMGTPVGTLEEDGLSNTPGELKGDCVRHVRAGRIRAVGRVIEMKQTLF